MKAILTAGLPASGKTTWTIENLEMRYELQYHIDKIDIKHKEVVPYVLEKIEQNRCKGISTIIFDYIFTAEDIASIKKSLDAKEVQIEVHFWIPDVQKCLWNDRIRGKRKKNGNYVFATETIKKMASELKIEDFGSLGVKLVFHEVGIAPKIHLCDLDDGCSIDLSRFNELISNLYGRDVSASRKIDIFNSHVTYEEELCGDYYSEWVEKCLMLDATGLYAEIGHVVL